MRSQVGDAIAAGLLVAATAVVGVVREPAATRYSAVKETTDSYALPPPEQTVTLSFGYRAALADVLWAHVLVSQGLRTGDRRRFEYLPNLLDSINALDPTFREPYLLTDALITFQVGKTSPEEVRKAREILERGLENLPLDGEVWLIAGQFVAYIAPSGYLTDEDEKAKWRAEGAVMLQRAAELSGDDSSIAWQALGAAGILHRAGEREASIRFLRRTQSVTDDEELKAKIQKQLDELLSEDERAAIKRQEAAFRKVWRDDLPFVSMTELLILGPPRDAAWCAGSARFDAPECARTWKEWAASVARKGVEGGKAPPEAH